MYSKLFGVVCGLALVAGCNCCSSYRSSEYGVPADDQYGMMPQEKSFVDRHPVLAAPRNYYRDSSDNFVIKVLAGTFVGVPVGIVREVGQVAYGQ